MIDRQALLNATLRKDLASFVRKAFGTLSPGTPFLGNWHLQAIAHRLMLCSEGEVKRLIITQPPRSMKSINSSVAFTAWMLGHDPSLRFICVSYSQDLADELAQQFRTVVNSDWYQELFPHTRFARFALGEFKTTKGGWRIATSIGGTLTGRGADYIIIDDPMKADDAQSAAARKRVIEWYRNTLVTRLNNQHEGRIMVVMQRLHEEDLAGYLMETGEAWDHLNLPVKAIIDEEIPLGNGQFHARKEGDLLHRERETEEVLEGLRSQLGSLNFAAQYQQSPVPLEGNLIKRDWFKRFAHDSLPDGMVVQSWDLASGTSTANDYSACVTAVVHKKQIYVIDVFRGRLPFPDLKRKIISHAQRFGAKTLLIEKAGPGLGMIPELKESSGAGCPTPLGITPTIDKASRLEAASVVIERGDVFLPQNASCEGDFLNELLAFPNGRHDDQADAFSQLINWHTKRNKSSGVSIHGPILIPFAEPYRRY